MTGGNKCLQFAGASVSFRRKPRECVSLRLVSCELADEAAFFRFYTETFNPGFCVLHGASPIKLTMEPDLAIPLAWLQAGAKEGTSSIQLARQLR